MQELSSKSASRATPKSTPPPRFPTPQLPDPRTLSEISKFPTQFSRKLVLLETEERVFGEILGLVGEIDVLRETLRVEAGRIVGLQVENPEVHEQVQCHGYAQKLTAQQCSDLEEENYELMKRIQELEGKQNYSLEEVAKIQREKYEELKQQLSDSQSTPSSERINQLKLKISQLKSSRQQRLSTVHPQFQLLREENEALRQRTVQALSGNNLERELRQYLQDEEDSRRQFMVDLQTYRAQFKELKHENEVLKSRLAAREKENSGYSNGNSHRGKERQQERELVRQEERVETGRKSRGGDRLGEYESIIRLMQNAKQ